MLAAGCAALTCGYENPTLRVISLLLIRMNYELRKARNGVSHSLTSLTTLTTKIKTK
jgi:hypothetical protein